MYAHVRMRALVHASPDRREKKLREQKREREN